MSKPGSVCNFVKSRQDITVEKGRTHIVPANFQCSWGSVMTSKTNDEASVTTNRSENGGADGPQRKVPSWCSIAVAVVCVLATPFMVYLFFSVAPLWSYSAVAGGLVGGMFGLFICGFVVLGLLTMVHDDLADEMFERWIFPLVWLGAFSAVVGALVSGFQAWSGAFQLVDVKGVNWLLGVSTSSPSELGGAAFWHALDDALLLSVSVLAFCLAARAAFAIVTKVLVPMVLGLAGLIEPVLGRYCTFGQKASEPRRL